VASKENVVELRVERVAFELAALALRVLRQDLAFVDGRRTLENPKLDSIGQVSGLASEL
jgi:hypothetical protein